MAWEIIRRYRDKVFVWRDLHELWGKPYAVTVISKVGIVEPVAGQYSSLKEAIKAAKRKLAEMDKSTVS